MQNQAVWLFKDSMITFESALRDAMHQVEMPFDGHFDFTPQKYHSFNSSGICHKKCCRYRIFENDVGAHFLCWRRDISVTWFYKDYQTLPPAQKSTFNKERQEQLDLKEKIRQEAILLAREHWWISTDLSPYHDYVVRKKIIPYEARARNDCILLPIYNWYGEIQSLQKIYPDGSKRFATKAPAAQGVMILGEKLTDTVFVCEGWATGCSLHEATGGLVIIAFSASNLPAIAPNIKKHCKKKRIIYCADDDKHGIGQRNAIAAARITGGRVILPHFGERHKSLTDFNDVSVHYGINVLITQLSI